MTLPLYITFFVTLPTTICANSPLPKNPSEILKAAHDGNHEAFELLIKNKQNLNIKDQHGNTPLHIAAKKGHFQIVESLASYAATAPDGYLDRLWQFFFGPSSPDINGQNNEGDTPLHCAAQAEKTDCLFILLRENTDISIKNKKQYTALLVAAEAGKIKNTCYLMGMYEDYYEQTINGDNILHIAINNNNYALAKKIIIANHKMYMLNKKHSGDNALVKAKNNKGETPLLRFAQLNNTEMIDVALQSGSTSTINTPDKDDNTPLSYACHHNNTGLVTNLVKNNANINKSSSTNTMPIHIAFNNNNYTLAAHLIGLGAHIDGQDAQYGNSPLHVATYSNDTKKIDWLLDHGADITKSNNHNMDALDIAISKKHTNLLPTFSSHGVHIDREDNNGKTRLMSALLFNNNDIVDALIELKANVYHKDSLNNNVLHIAALGNNLRGAEHMLQKTRNLLHEKNNYGNTPLHCAADLPQSFDVVKLYTDHKADINKQNNLGEAPLHRAIKSGNTQAIPLLTNSNTVALHTTHNNTPAHYALIYNNIHCLPLVLNQQSINTLNNDKKTIFHLAIEKNAPHNMLKQILAYGADITMIPNAQSGDSYLHLAVLYKHQDAIETCAIPALINKKNNSLATPLSYAVQQNDLTTVQLLLRKGALVNIPDGNGWTEIHHAATRGNDKILDILHTYGAHYEKRTHSGDTPLHIAAQYNKVSSITTIQKNNNNSLFLENDKGETPFMTAALTMNLEATKALLQEKDIITGKANKVLKKIHAPFFPSATQQFLEQQINQRKSECETIMDMQQKIENLLRINAINANLLKQRAIKEYYPFSYAYTPSKYASITTYTAESITHSLHGDRMKHKAFLEHFLQQEQREYTVLTTKLQTIEDMQKAVDLRIKREREEQEQVQHLAKEHKKQQAATIQEQANNKNTYKSEEPEGPENLVQENECGFCYESKQDAQRRCKNEKCTLTVCTDCIKTWRDKGNTKCSYCSDEYKK